MAVIVVCFGLLGSPTPPAAAQAVPPAKTGGAAEQLPSVGQILDRYVGALGGRAAIEKLASRVTKGWIEYTEQGQTVNGEVDIVAKAPDKLRVTFYFPGFVVEEGYDGAVAWEADTRGIVRTLRGERAANSRIDSQFYSDLRIAELFPQLRLLGTEVVDGEAAYVVEGVPAEGSRRWFYFSVKNGLLVRYDFEVLQPPRMPRQSMYLRGYREIDGVKVPMRMSQDNPSVGWTIHITEVRHNVPVDDDRFKKPPPAR